MKKLILLFSFFIFSFTALSDEYNLKGRVTDKETGEGIIGATVYVEGTTIGAVTDYNGNYDLLLEEGNYKLVASFLSYEKQIVEVNVNGQSQINFELIPENKVLSEVVVKAKIISDNETALIALKRKSPSLVDGISNQTFKRTGDANASEAIKRVNGVTVQDNKYVYVRGLGDRYTKTTINGIAIPGLDPDRNTVQMDLFPTNVISNISVYKTFTSNLYGDFTAGLIDIQTKNFIDNKHTSISLGTGFNRSTFNQNNLTYQKGLSEVPFQGSIPNEVELNPELETITKSFTPSMNVNQKGALPSFSFNINTGNKFNLNQYRFGYNSIFNFSNSYTFYSEVLQNAYLKNTNPSEFELFKDETSIGSTSTQNVNWNTFNVVSLKKNDFVTSLSLLRLNSESFVSNQRTRQNFNQTGATLLETNLSNSQRRLTNLNLNGEYNKDFKVNFDISNNWSEVNDPDFRTAAISITDGDTTLNVGDGAGLTRFFRNLNEYNLTLKSDVEFTINESTLKTGIINTYKNRDFGIQNFVFRMRNPNQISDNPNDLFANIWNASERDGLYVVGNFEPTNTYSASMNILGTYVSYYFEVSDFKVNIGSRLEKSEMYYTGQNNSGTVIYENENTLNELNILPTLNINYLINDEMNLRLSQSRTLARPSFKEKSIAQIFDPISNRTFFGNIDLEQTSVLNSDLRYEWFLSRNEMIAVSGFYKNFNNHIELVAFPTDPNSFKPRNVSNSWIYGIELEATKNVIENLSIGSNFSLIKSHVNLTSIYVNDNKTEFELRNENAKDGETIKTTRRMTNQSPYIVNTFINYNYSNFNFNISYNVQGESLSIVGSGIVPDVYNQPFHSLNLNLYKNIGKSKISFGVNNILNDKIESTYNSFNTDKTTFSSVNPGREYSLSYSYKF